MAWTDELNRGRRERRQLHTQPATAEQICFPHVEQIAQLYRHLGKHKPETVHLLILIRFQDEPNSGRITAWQDPVGLIHSSLNGRK
jgi:hypothetical protein